MLGAGKTEFVRGIVEGLGVEAEVSSPSFVRVHAYGGDPQVFHADFYLAKSEADALDDGLDELVTAGGIVLVEWADRFPHLIPPGSWWISIEWPGGEEDMRKIRIEKR